MAVLSDKKRAEMAAHEKWVRTALETAEEKADSWWTGLLNASDDAMDGVVRQAREKFTDWTGRRKEWVLSGVNDDRRVYTLEDWLGYGSDIAALVTQTTREYNAYTPENAVEYTVGESLEDVQEVLGETLDVVAKPWSFSTKAALWGLGGLAGLVALGYGLRPVVQLAAMAGGRKESKHERQ